ncbi:MAG TPA: hypothetical protein VEH62_00500 [Gemmatimonadales bacterium]|nr:hypothetical protein [Gemmatimonadales bacterium]
MRRPAAILVMALSCGLTAPALAQGARNITSLAGIDGIEVLVENLSNAQEALGLSEDALRADVLMRLRRGGVHVLSQVEECGALPCLYIHVTSSPSGPGTTAYFVHLGLQQLVSLSRDSAVSLSVETWRALGRIGLAPNGQVVERVRDAVRSEVDQFITAYQNANAGH